MDDLIKNIFDNTLDHEMIYVPKQEMRPLYESDEVSKVIKILKTVDIGEFMNSNNIGVVERFCSRVTKELEHDIIRDMFCEKNTKFVFKDNIHKGNIYPFIKKELEKIGYGRVNTINMTHNLFNILLRADDKDFFTYSDERGGLVLREGNIKINRVKNTDDELIYINKDRKIFYDFNVIKAHKHMSRLEFEFLVYIPNFTKIAIIDDTNHIGYKKQERNRKLNSLR